MVSYTQNHDLQLFADNEEPWEHRTDFQTIDTRLPIVDVNTNRSGYVAKTNAVYLASDTGDLYLGTGSSWNHIGRIGNVSVQDSGAAAGSAHTLNFDANLTASVTNGVVDIDSSGGGTAGDDIGTATDPIHSITNTHYREVTNEASVSGNYTVDLTTANVHKLTLTGDTTLSFTGDHTDLTTGCTLVIEQDGTGGHGLEWGDDIYWPGGEVPIPTSDPYGRDKIVVENVAGEWEGAVVSEGMQLIEAGLIENFEWGGPVSDRYQGSTAQYDIGTGHPTFEGDYAMEGVPAQQDTRYELYSQEGSGLPTNPRRGDSFGCWIRSSSLNDNRSGILFGVGGTDNHYIARVLFDEVDGHELHVAERVNGSFNQLRTDVGLSLSVDTWYDIQVNWQMDDTISVDLVDESGALVGSVSATSGSNADQTGFGYYMYFSEAVDSTSATYFDYARVL